MAQPAYPKIDELRVRLKADPKSRLFFPLAEELRKAGQLDEAEKVLRNGLANHPTYLSAWVSLGRVLRDLSRYQDATEPLAKALQLDPGNVVVARLMAENYYSLGEKVEAIKKYKLVHALLPADDDIKAMIERLDMELHPPSVSAAAPFEIPETEESPFDQTRELAEPFDQNAALRDAPSFDEPEPATVEESPFDRTMPPFAENAHAWDDRKELFEEQGAGDFEPMHYAHEESPFQEPVEGASIASVEIEAPDGIHIITAPPHANVAETVEAEIPVASSEVFERVAPELSSLEAPVTEEADVFGLDEETLVGEPEAAEVEEPMPAPAPEDMTNTVTMAELYVRQGLLEDAKRVYANILVREPGNDDVRARLSILAAPSEPQRGVAADADSPARRKIIRLQRWLDRVGGKGAGRV